MSERDARDEAMGRVKMNPNNHYWDLVDILYDWLLGVKAGQTFLAADLFVQAMKLDPLLTPKDKRVMGPVLRKLHKMGLIEPTGKIVTSTSKRSHLGDSKEWKKRDTGMIRAA